MDQKENGDDSVLKLLFLLLCLSLALIVSPSMQSRSLCLLFLSWAVHLPVYASTPRPVWLSRQFSSLLKLTFQLHRFLFCFSHLLFHLYSTCESVTSHRLESQTTSCLMKKCVYLMEHNAVQSSESKSTFRRNIMPPSSRKKWRFIGRRLRSHGPLCRITRCLLLKRNATCNTL
jgi:hypothetical protein